MSFVLIFLYRKCNREEDTLCVSTFLFTLKRTEMMSFYEANESSVNCTVFPFSVEECSVLFMEDPRGPFRV